MSKKLDKQLEEVQKQIEEEIQAEADLEDLANEISYEIFERLLSKGECDFEVNEVLYNFKMKYTEKMVVIAASNKARVKILQNKYKPFFINAEIDKDIGFEETLLACVKAFVNQQYGIIKAEEQ